MAAEAAGAEAAGAEAAGAEAAGADAAGADAAGADAAGADAAGAHHSPRVCSLCGLLTIVTPAQHALSSCLLREVVEEVQGGGAWRWSWDG